MIVGRIQKYYKPVVRSEKYLQCFRAQVWWAETNKVEVQERQCLIFAQNDHRHKEKVKEAPNFLLKKSFLETFQGFAINATNVFKSYFFVSQLHLHASRF